MNYRQDVTILLSKEAQRKLTEDVSGIFDKCFEKRTLKDGSLLLRGQWIPGVYDEEITRWLDRLDACDEIFEVLAMGTDLCEVEHFSNTIGEDRLSIERIVCLDGMLVDDIVSEGERHK
jgi:hypothetical protein